MPHVPPNNRFSWQRTPLRALAHEGPDQRYEVHAMKGGGFSLMAVTTGHLWFLETNWEEHALTLADEIIYKS